jgi:MFS family permease
MIGAMLYLTFHLQIVLGFPPLEAGLATLPMTLAIMVTAPIATKLLPKIGPRVLLIVGPLIAAVGLVYLSRITPDGEYLVQVLPALLILGVGMAMLFVPIQNLALSGVAPHDAGAASATANAAMQIGGSIGLSVFTTVYAGAVAGVDVVDKASQFTAFTTGYSAAFIATAVALVVASVLAVVFIRGSKESLLPSGDEKAVHLG